MCQERFCIYPFDNKIICRYIPKNIDSIVISRSSMVSFSTLVPFVPYISSGNNPATYYSMKGWYLTVLKAESPCNIYVNAFGRRKNKKIFLTVLRESVLHSGPVSGLPDPMQSCRINSSFMVSCFHHCRSEMELIDTMTNAESPGLTTDKNQWVLLGLL